MRHGFILRHRSSGETVQFRHFDEDQVETDPIAGSIGLTGDPLRASRSWCGRVNGKGSPDAADGALAQAGAPGHGAGAPAGGVSGARLQGQPDHALRVGVSDLSGRARSRFITEAVKASVEKSTPPFADALAAEPHLGAYLAVGKALCAGEYDAGTQRQGLSGLSLGYPLLQGVSFRRAEHQGR